MTSFFTNEEAKFESSSQDEREEQLKKTFFSSAISIGAIATIGSYVWKPDVFLYGGCLAAIIILVESCTHHYLPFRTMRAIGVLSGAVIASSIIALLRFYGVL